MTLTSHPDKRSSSRTYRIGQVASIAEVETAVVSTSPHFMLFLALDATGIADDVLRGIARKLLDRGLASLCVWGNDCSRVHDQFDLERHPDEPDGRVVETTWHSDEPLAEALWYFANVAYPDDSFERDCSEWVAIAVANTAWEDTIRTELVEKNEGWPP